MNQLNDLNRAIEFMLPDLEDGEQPLYCILKTPIIQGESHGWPAILSDEMFKRAENVRAKPERSFYINTMLAMEVDGEYRHKQANFSALFAVVLDDIGEKVNPNLLQPSLKIETSKGNFQWVYLLEEPITDIDKAKQLVAAVYETDLTDKGGALVNKFFRLPFGINNKMRVNGDGSSHLDEFEVRLIELNEDVFYSVDDLINAWGLELQPIRKKRGSGNYRPITGRSVVVPDAALDWISDSGRLLGGTDKSGFRKIVCPWNPEHVAGYSPLGEGGNDFFHLRGFHCFHDTCKGHDSAAFIEMVDQLGGPFVPMRDPVADLIGRFALIEAEKTVYDLSATAVTSVRAMSTSAFSDANQQIVTYGPKGGGITAYKKWIEHDQMQKLRGHHYNPAAGAIAINADGVPFLNSYLPPNHVNESGRPDAFLAHVRHVIPDEWECELFLDWMAFKLQHPESRSYAMLMVAGAYGIGRSILGSIIKRLVQGAAMTLDFDDLIGVGSQAQFNDWLDSNQFVIVNEVKQAVSNFQRDHSAYEAMKEVIDDSPLRGARCTPKYGKVFYIDFYGNFLMFSNHTDALQLPEDDRRFVVLTNSTVKRSIEEYAVIHGVLNDDKAIAQIYGWFMERDVSDFDAHRPPMTGAKRVMIEQGLSLSDRLVEAVLSDMKGDVATERQLLDRATHIAMSDMAFSVNELPKAISAMQMAIRKMGVINPEKPRSRVSFRNNGKLVQVPARIIRDVERWQMEAQAGNMKKLVEQVRLNGAT